MASQPHDCNCNANNNIFFSKTISISNICQVSCWCIGEFGDQMLTYQDPDEVNPNPCAEQVCFLKKVLLFFNIYIKKNFMNKKLQDVLALYERISGSSQCSVITKQFALTGLTKLATRFPNHARFELFIH